MKSVSIVIEKFSITIETLFTREKCFQSEKCFHSNRSSENCFQAHEKTREKNEVIPVRIEQNELPHSESKLRFFGSYHLLFLLINALLLLIQT